MDRIAPVDGAPGGFQSSYGIIVSTTSSDVAVKAAIRNRERQVSREESACHDAGMRPGRILI